ncbi:transposase [Nodosilinea sp. LEGE 07088]|uniref:transposase n=1 Tax=Nodosilinea sp. LEGE 07088 TaxID=2777968 RepID=UPI00187E2C4F|nr:transposase [Nodosilinea sp. LEGE 07088]MBE9140082.1 transposase [Nodosilinea sp. LEGE 07088]
MKYNPHKHHRCSLRLKGYDYSAAGAYFITICTFQRRCLFGQVVNGEMQLNEFGQIATECWQAIPEHFSHIELDEYIVMPNHVHGILVAQDTRRGIAVQCPYTNPGNVPQNPYISVFGKMSPGSIPAVVRSYKYATTKRINILRDAVGTPVWQRNYYDHIIRNERSLQHIRYYTTNNPLTWADDQLHPCNLSKW